MDNMGVQKTSNDFSPMAETVQKNRSPAKSQEGAHKSLAQMDLQSTSRAPFSVAELLQEDLPARKKYASVEPKKIQAFQDIMKELTSVTLFDVRI